MSLKKPNGIWSTDTVSTSATGANFVSLPNRDCDEVLVINSSGFALNLRAAGQSSGGVKIPDAGSPLIPVSGNAAEVQIRRDDQSNTPITVGFIYRRYT